MNWTQRGFEIISKYSRKAWVSTTSNKACRLWFQAADNGRVPSLWSYTRLVETFPNQLLVKYQRTFKAYHALILNIRISVNSFFEPQNVPYFYANVAPESLSTVISINNETTIEETYFIFTILKLMDMSMLSLRKSERMAKGFIKAFYLSGWWPVDAERTAVCSSETK